jgi:amino acid adenylation domain-containing protein
MMSNTDFLKEAVFDPDQFTKERDYWLNKLAGNLEKTLFPHDYNPKKQKEKKGEVEETRMGTVKFRFSQPLYAKLIRTINESDWRLHVILAAGLVLLLNKYTGNKDIILGTPIGKQEMKGDYINTALALRIFIGDNMTFKELIFQVREAIIEANQYPNYPVERLPYELNMPVSGNDLPLFDTAILLESIHNKEYIRHLNLNMTFSFKKTGEYIKGVVEYNASLYEKAAIERITSRFNSLMEEAFININARCDVIDILSKEEKRQLIVDFNDTQSIYPREKTMDELFRQQVLRTPGHTAVIYENEHLTYREFDKRANQLAHMLLAKGVKTAAIVAVMGKRNIEIIIGIMSILKSRGIYLPINAADPDERIRYIIKDSQTSIILTQTHVTREKREVFKDFSTGNVIYTDDKTIYSGEVGNPRMPGRPQDIAYLIYTSGTTGKPKGVIIEHQAVVNYIYWAAKTYVKNQGVNFPLYTSISFDMTITSIFTPLITGNAVVVYGGESYDFIIDRVIDDNRVGVVKLTPSHLRMIREKKMDGKISSIKRFILGGEELEAQLARAIDKNFNGNIEIYNEYGPTETTVGSMIYRFNPQNDNRESVPIGIPVDNTQIYILNGKQELLPEGAEGEIYISGDGSARGYLNRPELTAEKFLPVSPHYNRSYMSYISKKIYKTGDLARWLSDRNVEFLGRVDQQVKIRGYRIELGEIENQLLDHKEIKDAVTLLREVEGGEKYLCSYIVSDRELPVSELKAYLSEKLPDYMIPLFFVKVDRIPLTSNGKLDRDALPEPSLKAGGEYIAPRDKLDEELLKIWSKILNLGQEKISIDANFFELGGHSLKAATLVSKIHQKFNIKIKLIGVFERPTIRQLGRYIKDEARESFVSIEPGEKKEYYTLSSAQERLYILQQMEIDQVSYNIPIALKLQGKVDGDRFKQAFEKLIKRHESFRTSFALVEGVPVQRVHDQAAFKMEYYQVNREETGELVTNFIRPFDLNKTPLLRVGLVKIGNDRHILMLDMHHIISDGFSMNIFVKDFMALYRREILPALRIQYKDFSGWQNRQKEQEALSKQKEYWVNTFASEIPLLKLPTDYRRPPVKSFEGSTVTFEIDTEETKALQQMALEGEATLFMLLIAIYNVFLSKISSQEDIILGMDVLGRNHFDLEHIIGMFVNILVLRNYPGGEKTFKKFLNEVKESTLKAFENQDYQYEDLVDRLALNRDTSRNPLFDVMISVIEIEAEPGDISKEENSPLNSAPYEFEQRTSKFDLMLNVITSGEGLLLSFEYCSRIFRKATVERFISYFLKIVTSIIKNPEVKIEEIEIISDDEEKELLKAIRSGEGEEFQKNGEKSGKLIGTSKAEFNF